MKNPGGRKWLDRCGEGDLDGGVEPTDTNRGISPLIWSIGLLFLLLFSVMIYQRLEISSLEETVKSEARVMPKVGKIQATGGAELAPTRSRQRGTMAREALKPAEKLRLESLSKPLREDMMSSHVETDIAPGHALVTGGFPTGEGRHQFTVITPRRVPSPTGGQDQIVIESKVIDLDDATIAATGLQTLATQVRNTLQHGETWAAEDLTATLGSLEGMDGVSVVAGPVIQSNPASPFKVRVGDEYEFSGSADFSPMGDGVALSARIEVKGGE